MSRMARCLVCSHRYCEVVFVYVMLDRDQGDVKIGLSNNPTRRVGELRKSRGTDIRLVTKRAVGCRYTAPKVESAVQHRVGIEYNTIGDWFAVSKEVAVAALCAESPTEWVMP